MILSANSTFFTGGNANEHQETEEVEPQGIRQDQAGQHRRQEDLPAHRGGTRYALPGHHCRHQEEVFFPHQRPEPGGPDRDQCG